MTAPAAPGEPYVFLSYASVDRERAREVVDRIEASGVRVWVDEESLMGGASWGRQVVQGIRGCTAQVVLVSAASVASRNVLQEIQLGWKYERPYLPLFLERTQLPEQVEYWLEGWQWVEVLDHPPDEWLPQLCRALAGLGVTAPSPNAAFVALDSPSAPAATAPSAAAPSARSATPPMATAAAAPAAFKMPQTQYARSGDLYIAYQVYGEGPLDVVITPGGLSHVEHMWQIPEYRQFRLEMGAIGRVIAFDKRGTGLSDRVSESQMGTLEQRMDDVRAVMDAAGSERAVLLGVSEGAPMSILFAATFPERLHGLILNGSFAYGQAFTTSLEALEQRLAQSVQGHGTIEGARDFMKVMAPSLDPSPATLELWATNMRLSGSPGALRAIRRMNWTIDVRPVLAGIRVPTLVLHMTGDLAANMTQARLIAETIPNAQLIEFPGVDHMEFYSEYHPNFMAAIREFIAAIEPDASYERVLATVLVLRGDTQAAVSEKLQDLYRREIARGRGVEWAHEGDAVIATFDGPVRAVRCARAIIVGARSLGLAVRAGLHSGECELRGDAAGGEAVRVASGIAASAEPGEVLISGAVQGLIAGAGLTVIERGTTDAVGTSPPLSLFTVQ